MGQLRLGEVPAMTNGLGRSMFPELRQDLSRPLFDPVSLARDPFAVLQGSFRAIRDSYGKGASRADREKKRAEGRPDSEEKLNLPPDNPDDLIFVTHCKGKLKFYGTFRFFPFDEQVLVVRVVLQQMSDEILFTKPHVRASEAIHRAMVEKIAPYWTIHKVSFHRLFMSLKDSTIRDVSQLEIGPSELNQWNSAIELRISISRNWMPWIVKVVFPIDLITISSLAVFLIARTDDTNEQLARLTFSITVVLALAAYSISMYSLLPRASYLTLLDWHSLWSFLVLVLSMIAAIDRPTGLWQPIRPLQPFWVPLIMFFGEHLLLLFLILYLRVGTVHRITKGIIQACFSPIMIALQFLIFIVILLTVSVVSCVIYIRELCGLRERKKIKTSPSTVQKEIDKSFSMTSRIGRGIAVFWSSALMLAQLQEFGHSVAVLKGEGSKSLKTLWTWCWRPVDRALRKATRPLRPQSHPTPRNPKDSSNDQSVPSTSERKIKFDQEGKTTTKEAITPLSESSHNQTQAENNTPQESLTL
ncbi:hypothetical protein BT69DRAFT_401321 [Atractiella rhizophila]|nr:hypothetical protein BT69DRAFT_401321 [Atractiella rhizophila]